MIVLNILLTFLAVGLCLPVAVFCLEVLLSLFPQRKKTPPALPPGAKIAVLIPAHDEQAVIAATLRTLIPTLPPNARVLVVADNCTDSTAQIARQHGAEVIERFNRDQRGKGFALDFGIQHLAANPPAAIVFLDADCAVATDTVRLLAAAAITSQRPVQGLNLCDPDPRGGVLQLASGLAFRFKNLVRASGLVRLAGVTHLTGTGMALPWSIVEKAEFASGNMVEDMQLGIDLVLAGKPPIFLPEARVDSPLPQERSAARTQRTRWEHGHLSTLLKQSPRLLALAITRRRTGLAWLALDLAIPPLSLLVIALTASTLLAAAACLLGTSPLPFAILSTATAALALSVLAGWAAHCRHQVPLFTLLAAPLYIAFKLPIYLAFLLKRQQNWVRTHRDAASN